MHSSCRGASGNSHRRANGAINRAAETVAINTAGLEEIRMYCRRHKRQENTHEAVRCRKRCQRQGRGASREDSAESRRITRQQPQTRRTAKQAAASRQHQHTPRSFGGITYIYIDVCVRESRNGCTHVLPRGLLHRLHHLQHRVTGSRACAVYIVRVTQTRMRSG